MIVFEFEFYFLQEKKTKLPLHERKENEQIWIWFFSTKRQNMSVHFHIHEFSNTNRQIIIYYYINVDEISLKSDQNWIKTSYQLYFYQKYKPRSHQDGDNLDIWNRSFENFNYIFNAPLGALMMHPFEAPPFNPISC
jgi:hypothetical protein